MTMTLVRRRLLGLAGIALVMAFVVLMLGIYEKAFVSTTMVTVDADRAGLLLDEGSDVRAFGVPIGEVRSIRSVRGRVSIEVALDRDMAKDIPSGATSTIQASTVFGSKYISLDVPRGKTGPSIRSGEVIRASDTTVEVNDVFESTLDLVSSIDPAQLNSTLTTMATTLDGRGERLGELLEGSRDYLRVFNRRLPQLRENIERSDDVLRTYKQASPELIDTLSQAGTTSRTVASKRGALDDLLDDSVSSAGTIEEFVDTTEEPLAAALRQARPVTGLLRDFAPAITCIITSLDAAQASLEDVLGKDVPGVQTTSGFLPAQDPYRTSKNLPKFITGVGPTCQPLPTAAKPNPPHINFKDGTEGVYDNDPGADPQTPVQVYEGGFADFFGDSGLLVLLDDLANRDVP
ncbi:MCE family protein [Aeromicrobium sp.]|uniref:MCE family protein n=1 Tax=Aeromicrobium sp. TaxID=1871063 RepID=UPI0030C26FC7